MYTVLYTSACYPCDSLGHIVHCITVVLCEYVMYLPVHVQCTCTVYMYMYVCMFGYFYNNYTLHVYKLICVASLMMLYIMKSAHVVNIVC